MKLHWLLPGTFLTVFMLSSPARAAMLSWGFDPAQNRRSIETKSAVQPPLLTQSVEGTTQIDSLRVTGDGLFIRTTGGNPQVTPSRSGDRNTIYLDISDAVLSQNLHVRDVPINRYGVSSIQFIQLDTSPSTVRVVLQVDKDSPDWEVTKSPGGLVVLPNRLSGMPKSDNSFPSRPKLQQNTLTTIDSVELRNDTQVVIRGDQNLSASGSWDRSSGLFRIIIPNARLAATVRGPILDYSSPVLRIRLQQDRGSVAIYVQPAAGVRIGQVNSRGDSVALELKGSRRLTSLTPSFVPPLPRPIPQQYPPSIAQNSLPYGTGRQPNGRVVVIVDPGHGGYDSGAVGIGGLLEKDIVLPIGRRLAEVLEQNGVQVILTRNSDYFVTLQGRVDMAQQASANLFVSVHANSAGSSRPDVNGLEVYYYDSGLGLANTVHDSILQNVNVKDRGIRKARFFVLRKSSMPSILVETGYMTGQEDIAKLQNPQYQDQMAEAIARGILQYLRTR